MTSRTRSGSAVVTMRLLEVVEEFENAAAAAGIEFAEDVIEQDDGIVAEDVAQVIGFREPQGESAAMRCWARDA